MQVEYYLVKFTVINQSDKQTAFAVLDKNQMRTFENSEEYTIDTDEGVRHLEYESCCPFSGPDKMKDYFNNQKFAKKLISSIQEDLEDVSDDELDEGTKSFLRVIDNLYGESNDDEEDKDVSDDELELDEDTKSFLTVLESTSW